jgi:hypothetical protein
MSILSSQTKKLASNHLYINLYEKDKNQSSNTPLIRIKKD